MDFKAISDRILIIQDEMLPMQETPPQTGIIFSIGGNCSQEGLSVKEGERVLFAKGGHPKQGEYLVIRETQLYAVL